MIDLAKAEAIMLHMHQGQAAECEEESQEEDDVNKNANNGVYYDIRIKSHYCLGEQQVIFVFTNVSAEKEL